MRTSRKLSADRRKNSPKRVVYQAVQHVEGLESRLFFNGTLPTTVFLASPSPNPYTGTPSGVTLAVTVTGTGGPTPTGTITFFAGSQQIGAPQPLVGGAVILTNVTTLPIGNPDLITADYSGDANYASNNSTAQPEVVTGSGTTTVGTTTTLNSPTTTAPVGTNITFTANVSPATGGGPALTGSVTFFDGTNALGPAVTVDASGNAVFSTSTLAVGARNITASYGGDTNYSASNSAIFVETITSASGTTASTTTVNTLTPTITAGTAVTFNATVAPAGATGTVQFLSNGAAFGVPQTVTAGAASITTSSLAVGSDIITAVYSGDSTFASSTSAPITETVNPGALTATTTTVNSGTPTVMSGTPVTFTATVAPGAATGTVQFFSNGTAIGAPQNVVGGVASLTTAALAVGTDAITATYSGDTTFSTSTSGSFTETVNPSIATTTTTLTAFPTAATVGNVVNLTANVSPGSATGTVQFFDGTTALGSPVPLVGGTATLAVTSLIVGAHSITASYSGDATDTPSVSAAVTVTETIGAPVLAISSSAPTTTFGSTVTFTATVGPTTVGGPFPTGTVIFSDGTTAISGPVTLTNGVATFDDSTLAVGSHSISFAYIGDTNYSTGTSGAIIETVNTAPTVTTLTTSPNPVQFQQGVTLTATVSPNAATGTITFFDGTTSLGPAVPIMNGSASMVTFTLATGTDAITAVYSGDGNYSPSTSAATTESVTLAPSSTLVSASASTIVYGNPITLTADVLANGVTGDVSFFSGTTLLGTATLSGNFASITTSALTVGADNITAVFAGDGNFTGSTSAPTTVNVTQGLTTTTVSPDPTVVATGAPVTFTVTVTPVAGTAIPTGTVTLIEDGTTVIPTNVSLVNGSLVYTTTTLALGLDSIVATYSGDSNYLASTSDPVNVGVSAITTSTSTTTISSTNQSPNYGTPVTLTAIVAPALSSTLTPDGTVTFFDGTVPLGAPVQMVDGVAFITTSSLPPGVNNVTAVYNGDQNFTPSTSAPIAENVVGNNNSGVYVTTLDVSTFNALFGSPVTLTATVFPSSVGTPPPFGGTVTFFAGSQTLGAATLTADGKAVFSTPLPAGTDQITAAYNGGGPTTSSLPRMVAISSPATPSLGKVKLPPSILAGTSMHTNLPIAITNMGAAQLKGLFTIQVYLDSSPTLDANRDLLTTMSKTLTLKGKKSRVFRTPETLPSTLAPGTYYLLVDVTDPSGLTSMVASSPIVVAAPFVGLTATVSATNPPNIGVGQSAALFVTLTNTGNENISGPLSLTLSPSSDGVTSIPGKILGTGAINTTIQPGKSRKFRVMLDTTSLANGSYFPFVSISLDGVSITSVGITPFRVG